MQIYISTPINARKEATFAEKLQAAKQRVEYLKKVIQNDKRYAAYNCIVHTNFDGGTKSEAVAMGICIRSVLSCDAIYMDSGWQSSKGCTLEYHAAKIYGKTIYEHETAKVEPKLKAMSDKEKAHQIAWETSKHYDPLLSKESWCEMAALDMASWKNEQNAWSEKGWTMQDEEELQIALDTLIKAGQHSSAKWLKNVCFKPQNIWKPSNEQMKALKESCDEHWEPDGLDPLYTLYQDLKKLKE